MSTVIGVIIGILFLAFTLYLIILWAIYVKNYNPEGPIFRTEITLTFRDEDKGKSN